MAKVSGKSAWEKALRIAMSLVLVVGLCPIASFATVGEALASTELVAASVGDTTIVASGTYVGYGANTAGGLSSTHAYYLPLYRWVLYEDGLLSLDLADISDSGLNSTPGWKEYADQITRIEMTASYSSYFSYYHSSSTCYHSTITSKMFADLPNLTTVNAPYVKMVGSETFAGCVNLQDVTIGTSFPGGIFLFSSAFSGCASLSRVTIGNSGYSATISASAFKDCSSLSNLTIASTSGTVGDNAFSGCTALRSVDVSQMTSIGNSVFEGCTRLRSVTLPSETTTTTYLGTAAFRDCPALESITLPSGTKTLSANAFENDSALKTATLPASITSVGASAFRNCISLNSVTDTSSLQSIASDAFNGCSSLRAIDLPEGLTSIGQYAFKDSGVTDVTVPSTVTSLTQNAFNGCPDLKTVTVSPGVGSLGASSFANCAQLEKVTLGQDVLTISSSAFANDPKLSEVRFQGEAPTIAPDSYSGVTAAALYPIENEYWTTGDMLDYGGSLTWSPYGDISSCSLSADSLAYTGSAQEPTLHLIAQNGLEVSPNLFTAIYYADEACTELLDAASVKNPGTYYIVATGNDSEGCTGSTDPVAFEISKAPLTISYVSETVDAGQTPAYEIAYEGFVGDDDESSLTTPATLSTPSTLLPGHSYTLTPEGASADNYDITFESGTLAVSPARIDKPVCAGGLVYTGKDQTAIAAGTGYTLSGVTHAVNVGEYEATIQLEDGYAWADGSLDPLTYTWSIDKATLQAAFVDETIDAGETPALEVAVTGFVDGETAGSAAGYSAPTATVSSTLKPGYSHTVLVSGGSADNYKFEYTSGKVTVRPMVVSIPDATLSFAYDGAQKSALAAGEGYDLTGTWQATDAGSYTAVATLRDGYEWSDGTNAAKRYTWSIAAKPGSLTLDDASLSLNVGESGDVAIQYVGDGALGVTTSDASVATASVKSDAVTVKAAGEGTARITLTSSACTNYTTPSSVTLYVTVESFDLSGCTLTATGGTYSGKPFDAQVKVLLPNGAELSADSSHVVRYYDSANCDNEIAAGNVVNAGTYWVRAEAVAGGRSSGHTSAVSFTIDKATLSARYAGEVVEYGAQAAGNVSVSGFVAGESASSAKGYVAPAVTLPESLERAASYYLVPADGYADNYDFSYTGGTLSVKSMVVDVPTAATGLAYTGASQTGVATGSGYVLSGTYAATDAGTYTATATLEDGCVWADGTTASKSIRWTISTVDIARVSASSLSSQKYTGTDMQPRPTLSLGDYTLVLGKDYTLSYSNNRNVGTATVKVTGKGNFTSERTLTFKITAVSIYSATISGIASSYSYTGSSIAPVPVVTCDGSTLTKDVDYTVSYSNNIAAGTASLYVYGKGNYSGSTSATFQIKKVSLEYATISDIAEATYTGSAITPKPLVSLDGRTLAEGQDYTVSYANNVNTGIATATFTGQGSVGGSVTKNFVIKPASIAQASITGIEPSYVYEGAEVRPIPVVTLGGATLTAGTDYVVSYSNNTGVGEASVSVIGMGNYTGSNAASFAIAKAAYDLSGISLEGATVTYDGKSHSLAIAGNLPDGVSVNYAGNDVANAGEHAVTATFVDDGTHEVVGSMSATLLIEKAPVAVPTPQGGLVYNGSTQNALPSSDQYVLSGNEGVAAGSYEATASLADSENYQWADGSISDKTIAWTISKASLVAAYSGDAITYGDTPTLAVNVSGFVGGEDASTAAGYVAPAVYASSLNAGTYQLQPTGGSADNYEFTYQAGTLSIAKAKVMVVANSAVKPYGTADPELTYSIIDTPSASYYGPVSISRVAGEDVGEYEIAVYAQDDANYQVVPVGAKLTITKAPYDMSGVSFTGARFAYDGNVHSLQVSGSLPEGVSFSYTGNNKVSAGEYAVRAIFSGDANHLPINPMEATLIIDKASVAIPMASSGLVYTGLQQTGVAAGRGYSIRGNVGTSAGEYKATAALNDTANYQWSDGTTTPKEIAWSIAKGTYDMSYVVFPNGRYTYDGKAHSLAVRDLPAGVTVSYENNGKTQAGTYLVVAHFTGNPNYEKPADKAAALVIDAVQPVPKTLDSCTVSVANCVYDGTKQKPEVVVRHNGVTLANGKDYSLSYYDNQLAGTGTVVLAGKGSYTGFNVATFTIEKAQQQFTAKGRTLVVKYANLKNANLVKTGGVKITGEQGKVTYKKVSGHKKIKVNKKNGRIVLKKKSLKKGTYTVAIKVTAAGDANYAAATKVVNVKIRVK